MFKIHSTARSVHTRTTRAAAAQKPARKLLIGGGDIRVVPGMFATISEATLQRLRPELKILEGQGAIKLTDMQNRRINIDTLEVIEQQPVVAQPTPRLDSIANDLTYEHGVGNPMPQFPGGKAESEAVTVPSVIEELKDDDVQDVAQEELLETPEAEMPVVEETTVIVEPSVDLVEDVGAIPETEMEKVSEPEPMVETQVEPVAEIVEPLPETEKKPEKEKHESKSHHAHAERHGRRK